MAAGFPRTFPSRLLPPATFVQGTIPLTSRRPRLLLLLLLPTSPPDVSSHDLRRRRHHRDDGCVMSHHNDDFIVGNSNIPLKGEEGKEKTCLS
jgi:hypothetical protein